MLAGIAPPFYLQILSWTGCNYSCCLGAPRPPAPPPFFVITFFGLAVLLGGGHPVDWGVFLLHVVASRAVWLVGKGGEFVCDSGGFFHNVVLL